MPELIAALDIGTTGARIIIFSHTGQMLASAYQEYPIITTKPGWVEQDANLWWSAVRATTKKVLAGAKNKVDPSDIRAIIVTNQRETIVPVDKSGTPLDNAIVWQDRRTVGQCEGIKNKLGNDKIYKITGLTIDPYFSASKILWFKEYRKKVYDRAHKFLLVHDFIVNKLTGEFVTDFSNASRTMLYDIKKLKWSDQIGSELEISIDKLPETFSSGKKVGELTSVAAKATGLKAGTTVLAGGGDQQCAALGLGINKEGLVEATTGTGSFVLAHLDEPKFDKKRRVICSVSVLPESWVLEASIFTTGALYRWFRDNLAGLEKLEAAKSGVDVYELLNKKLDITTPGANGLLLLPYFAGAGAPYWDPNATGVLHGLSLATTREDILRAIIESTCFEIRKSLEVFNELGLKIEELRIAGGATRSETWNQIQADIYGIPVIKTAYEETTALGAALIGFVRSGVYKNYSTAVEHMVECKQRYVPDTKLRKLYDEIYLKNKEFYDMLSKHGFY